MTRRAKLPRPAAEPHASDFGATILHPDTGEVRYAIPIVVEDVAVGTRATSKRARRADPLSRVDGCTDAMRTAAAIYRQAVEHSIAGRGMGPLPWAADRVQEARRGDGLGVVLLPQERAVTAAEWYRRGVQAMGLAASQGVVQWVVIRGATLASYDRQRRWREGTGCAEMLAALGRLAEEYRCA